MKKTLITCFLILITTPFFSLDLQGYISNQDKKEIQYCTLILPSLDIIDYTDENGHFSIKVDDSVFKENEALEFIVSCDGYLDKQIILTSETEFPLEIILEDALVDMGTISVTEEKEQITNPVDIYTKEDMEKIPTGGDPLQVLTVNSGIWSGSEILHGYEDGINRQPVSDFEGAGRIPIPDFIFRGISPYENLYYYDYIRMPTLYHTQGYPVPASIIPEPMLGSMEITKGGYDSSFGSGYGGVTSFKTRTDVPEEGTYEITTSLANAGFYFEQPIIDPLSVYGSVNKSLYDYTIQPLEDLITDYVFENEGTFFQSSSLVNNQDKNYGDFDYSIKALWFPTKEQSLSFNFIGLYDYEEICPNKNWIDNYDYTGSVYPYNITTQSNFYYEKDIDYYLHGQGLNWDIAGNKLANYFYFSHLYIVSNNEETMKVHDIFQDLFADDYRVENDCYIHQLQGGDQSEFQLPFDMKLETGAEYIYVDMTAAYRLEQTECEYLPLDEGEIGYNFASEDWTYASYDPDGLQIIQDCSSALNSFEVNSYFNLSKTISSFTFFAGPRIDYFHYFEDYYLSTRGGIAFSDDDKLDIVLSGGTYPGKLDYLSITRGVYYEDENKYIPTKISHALSGNLDLGYQITEKLRFDSAIYGYLISDLSAASILLDDKIPSQGKSWGAECELDFFPSESQSWQLHYTWGRSLYLVENEGWLSPDSEVIHTLILQNSFKPLKSLTLGMNLKLYMGQRYTPILDTVILESGGYYYVYGDYNSELSYSPDFNLDFSIRWKRTLKKGDMELFFDLTDIISGYTWHGSSPYQYIISYPFNGTAEGVEGFVSSHSVPAFNFGVKFSF